MKKKIEIILYNKLEFNGDHAKCISDVKAWLYCEWQCDMIEDMPELNRLLGVVDSTADRILKSL